MDPTSRRTLFASLPAPQGQWIDGTWRAAGEDRLASVDPAFPDMTYATYQAATDAHIDAAMVSAARAFRGAWAHNRTLRAAALRRLAEQLRAHKTPIAHLQALDGGLSVTEGLESVEGAAELLEYYASRLGDDTLWADHTRHQRDGVCYDERRVPLGIVVPFVRGTYPFCIW